MAAFPQLRTPTPEDPLRILMSACLGGIACGYDGTNNGEYPGARQVFQYPTAKVIRFCPEEFSFGTPRALCDIHGGNGFDVLDGKARVFNNLGEDWTPGMIRAAAEMLDLAIRERIELALLLDMSAACGSQVISLGNRLSANRTYQKGPGVCAAQLIRYGIPVISQRDFASLEQLYAKLDPAHRIDTSRKDHDDSEWYRDYFEIG